MATVKTQFPVRSKWSVAVVSVRSESGHNYRYTGQTCMCNTQSVNCHHIYRRDWKNMLRLCLTSVKQLIWSWSSALEKTVSGIFSHLGSPSSFDGICDTYLVCVVPFHFSPCYSCVVHDRMIICKMSSDRTEHKLSQTKQESYWAEMWLAKNHQGAATSNNNSIIWMFSFV